MFQNLLANAIEYSDNDSPRVHISAEQLGPEYDISVRDEGIDPENQDRIFDVFERFHAREDYSGTGIGLALCDRTLNDTGAIQVESTPGDGATFTVSLPSADGGTRAL